MDFSSKCNVLGDLWLYYREDAKANEAWEAFFTYNDVSLPLSYGIAQGHVILNEEGDLEVFVDETWDMFCEYIGIDPEGEYEDINSAWAASSQPPLNQEEVEETPAPKKRTRKKAEPPSS
jgi:hypothetical protein